MSVVEPGGGGDVPEIPDGLYQATIKSVVDVILDKPDNFGNSEKVEIHLSFTDSDGVSQTLEPRINRKWGEKANLYLIALACGLNVAPHEAFDTEDLVNCKVNVLVETEEGGRWPRVKSWGRVKNGKAAPLTVTANGDSADFDGFWKKVRAAGFEQKDVLPHVNGDLRSMADMRQADLDLLLEAMGV